MSVDKTTVANIAHLARIDVDDDELEQLAADLSSILQWIEQLNEVDTDNVPPMVVSYTHLTLPTTPSCRSRWSPYH